jgi:hypothetical protein
MADKGTEFGSIPTTLLTSVTAFIGGVAKAPPAGSPAGTQSAAIDALIALAVEENAASYPKIEPNVIDVVLRVVVVNNEFENLQKATAAVLDIALTSFKGKVDELTKYFQGK